MAHSLNLRGDLVAIDPSTGLHEVLTGGRGAPPLPATCECDKFLHETGKPRCQNEPEGHGTVRSSPALCTRCLFYCYNDDEDF